MIDHLASTTELRRWLERQIAAAVLLDPDHAVPRASKWIGPGDFATPALRNVFVVACELADCGRPVTLPSVLNELARTGRFPKPEHGAASLLSEVVGECATAALVEQNARSLRRLSLEERARILHSEAIEGGLSQTRTEELRAILKQVQVVSA